MANHPSSLKRIRSSERRRKRNRLVRSGTRSAVKKARMSISAGNVDEAEAAVLAAVSALDSAASKGVIHKNNAARRKSRLFKQLAKLEE